MTPEEFDVLPPGCFDGRYRYEIIRGVLVVSPPVAISEADPNDELGHLLRTYQANDPRGSALDRTVPERTVPTTNRRRADRVIWAGLGRIPDIERDVPAIVIEFVSKSRQDRRRDYQEKLEEYLEAGVREYWIIDRFRRIMIVHRNTPGGLTTLEVKEGDTYRTDLLPGFVLPLARLLAKADDWKPKRRRRKRPARGAE